MKLLSNTTLLIAIILVSGYGYIAGCTHKDLILPDPSTGTVVINRGTVFFFPERKQGVIQHNGKWTRYIAASYGQATTCSKALC